jgi:hypothetical protein
MNDIVQLFPEADAERDEAIFKAWRKGQSVQKLARDYNLSQSHVTAIIDQCLPSLTPRAQVRELRRLLCDLEELREQYHGIAMAENDAEAANVSIRTAHEIAQLRQFVGGGQHIDPIQLTKQVGSSREKSTDAIVRAIASLARNHAPPEPETLPSPTEPIEAQAPEPARTEGERSEDDDGSPPSDERAATRAK